MATTTTFRSLKGTVAVGMITETCCNCGVVFAMVEEFRDARLRDGKSFYCPAGHAQVYTETAATKLAAKEKELAQMRDRLASEKGWSKRLEDDLVAERRQHSATKGQLTKTRNRIQAGVCPDCHRHFANVERHMASKHPEASS